MTLYEIPVRTIDGRETTLAPFRGQVLLLVNVASQCGLTPQYEALEALHRRHGPRGFSVLGFPCNQFGNQEPGTEAEIQGFCTAKFGVTFPLFAKLEVNGPGAHPLYEFLKRQQPGLLGTEAIKWNFTKFLAARDGTILERAAPMTSPQDLEAAIVRALEVPRPA